MTLRISEIQKQFGGNIILDKISTSFLPNRINLLIGANGSGKTTLINIISGLFGADKGNIFFKDYNITNYSSDKIFLLGITRTFQTPRLFANLSVLENMLLASTEIDESFSSSLFGINWKKNKKSIIDKSGEIRINVIATQDEVPEGLRLLLNIMRDSINGSTDQTKKT